VELIRRIIEVSSDPNDLILDSFAGSGTTAQAVMEENNSRCFILVQMPHDNKHQEEEGLNICNSITAERVRRVANGYKYRRRLSKGRVKEETIEGLGGTFTYARLGEPLFGQYKDFGEELPSYEDLAKYIFYTETSHEFPGKTKKQNPAWDKRAGRIGEHGGRSYYLLYEPNDKLDKGLDRAFLNDVATKDPHRELVVYCERLAVHQDELRKFYREHGKKIRHMLVPFNLR